MASPTTRASAVLPCFHGCLTFLHRHFPPHPPPSHPLNLSLCSQQQPSPWDYSTIPKLHIPVRGMYGCGKDCLILIPFRLLQISCFTLSLKCFSSESDNCPDVGIRLLHQFPHPLRAGPVVLALLFFPLVPSHRVLCGSMYSFPLVRYSCLLSAGGLYALLCLKGVFLMHPWREMYSTSTYSSAILFSRDHVLFIFNPTSKCKNLKLNSGLCY